MQIKKCRIERDPSMNKHRAAPERIKDKAPLKRCRPIINILLPIFNTSQPNRGPATIRLKYCQLLIPPRLTQAHVQFNCWNFYGPLR